MRKSDINHLIIAIMVTLTILWTAYLYTNAVDNTQDIYIDPKVMLVDQEMSIEEFEAIVMKMPNSALKSCLLTCIGAAYGGDIDQLHIIMKEFSRLKLLELKTKGQI